MRIDQRKTIGAVSALEDQRCIEEGYVAADQGRRKKATEQEALRAAEQEAQDLRQREEEERMRVAEAEAREAARLEEEEAQKEAARAKAHAEEKARHVLAANAALAAARKLVASSSTAPSAEGAALDAAQAKVSRIALKWWLSREEVYWRFWMEKVQVGCVGDA